MANVILVERAFIVRDEQILFVHRSPDHSHNPDLWEVPGGQVQEGELPDESLAREITEETGLKVKRTSPPVASQMWRYITDEGPYLGMLYLAHYSVFAVMGGGEVSLSQEHDGVIWLAWDESFRLPNLTPETLYMLGTMAPWLP